MAWWPHKPGTWPYQQVSEDLNSLTATGDLGLGLGIWDLGLGVASGISESD